MEVSHSFSAEDAETAVRRSGIYSLDDPALGNRVDEFRSSRFPTKSPLGLEFLAQNSLDRKDVRGVCEAILGRPHWGLIKIYSDKLPSDCVYRFHIGSKAEANTLLVQLWSPKSKVTFFVGSHRENIGEIDQKMSNDWGLLVTRRADFSRTGISENITEFEHGGLAICDSRIGFHILQGYVINIGFTTAEELGFWAKMELPHSKTLETKIEDLEGRGFSINYTWRGTRTAAQNT